MYIYLIITLFIERKTSPWPGQAVCRLDGWSVGLSVTIFFKGGKFHFYAPIGALFCMIFFHMARKTREQNILRGSASNAQYPNLFNLEKLLIQWMKMNDSWSLPSLLFPGKLIYKFSLFYRFCFLFWGCRTPMNQALEIAFLGRKLWCTAAL